MKRIVSRYWVAISIFFGLLLAFFYPVVFQGKVIAPLDILDHLMRPWSDGSGGFGVHNAMVYDAISQYLPYDWAVCQSIKADGYIGWNPYVYGGYALLENTMLCPGDWHHQLYRFFDFWTAWNLGILLQFALAGIGMIVMLRGEGLSGMASLLGAVAFAFYSQHVVWIYHRWVLGASCWFPWMVWAIRRARRRNCVFDFRSSVFTALAFRGGSLQTCLFVATLVFCLFLADWLNRGDKWSVSGTSHVAVPYVVLAFFSSVLAFDVIAATIPPFLDGCRTMEWKSPLQYAKSLPTLITCVFPTVLGTPQTIDGFKLFGAGLFDLKFAGAIPFFLALFAFRRKSSPLVAKILFVAGLAIPFTPLCHWFYSRSTVLFALGCAWLAAWSLAHPDALPSSGSRLWRRFVAFGAILSFSWLVAGIFVQVFSPQLRRYFHEQVANGLTADKASRLDWMTSRSDAFLDAFPVWRPLNLLLIFLVSTGLFAIWRRSSGNRRELWTCVILVVSSAELFVWSRLWVTFSDRPKDTTYLYSVPDWADRLQKEMSDGGFLWVHGRRPDFDYFQLNVQSGIGISSLQGYETIRPASLSRPDATRYDSLEFAERGVSHVMVLPGADVPPGLADWICVENSDALHLFRNPAFDSRWHADLSDGSRVALHDQADSPNRHRFELPSGTEALTLAEPFHRHWIDSLEAEVRFFSEKSATAGTRVVFDTPLSVPVSFSRTFRRPVELFTFPFAGFVFLVLASLFARVRFLVAFLKRSSP